MKKILSVIMSCLLIFSFTACGSKKIVNEKINGPDDLIGKKVGVQLGTTGDIYVSDLEEEGTVVERYSKGFEAIQALKQGKVDAVIIDDQPAQVFVSQNNDISILEEKFTVEDYALCISKSNTDLKDSINKAISELKQDGTLQSILDYYIGDVEGAKRYESPPGINYSGTLVMATNAEFPPYEFHDGDAIAGIDPDFAKAICDKLGKELKIEDMNFDSIIVAVQSGKADFGAAGMTITKDRLQSIDFSDTYCTASQVIIVRK